MPEITEGLLRILIGLVALLLGWVIGFFDSRRNADKKIRQVEEKAARAIQQAQAEAERLLQMKRVAPPASSPKTGKTLLRLWLDEHHQPHLELDEQAVEVDPLAEPHRKRLLTLLALMRPWLEGRPAAPTPPRPASSPPSATVPPSADQTPPRPASPSPGAVPGSAPVSSPTTSTPPRPDSPPSRDLPGSQPVSEPVLRPARPVSPIPSPLFESEQHKPATNLSIVEEINTILQARLAASPLAHRSIRLQESPQGGVIVWVGLQKFAGIDEVPDPEIRAILRAAIEEWERRR